MKKVIYLMTAVILLSGCVSRGSESTETLPGRDYQRCLDAEQMGGGELVASRCGKLSEEIEK